MGHLSAKKVLAFAQRFWKEEIESSTPTCPADPEMAIFRAITEWDARVRSNFSWGMEPDQNEILPDGRT